MTVKILFGSEAVRDYEDGNSKKKLEKLIQEFTFNTQEEINAFLLGLNVSQGWEDYLIIG